MTSQAQDEKPSTLERALKPWKYLGYPAYSEFVASDAHFCVFRRFDDISARLLLFHQDRITRLEERLKSLDATASKTTAVDQHNGSFRDEEGLAREKLLKSIDEELTKYHKQLLRYYDVRKLPAAPRDSIESIQNWHHNHGQMVIDSRETEYIKRRNDLSMLNGNPPGSLSVLLERLRLLSVLKRWRDPRNEDLDTDSGYIQYTSDELLHSFSSILILLVGTAMLIAPLWILAFTKGHPKQLGVATAFIVFFIGVLSTTARPFETLAAAAAYSAVLMVFLQINN